MRTRLMMMPRSSESLTLQAKLFRGLCDGSRLAILEALRHGPLTVGRLVEVSGLSQSNTSNHLRCLSECGLVVGEQQGRFVRYRLRDRRIKMILRLADELLAEIGRQIFACTNYRVDEKKNKRRHAANGSKTARASQSASLPARITQ